MRYAGFFLVEGLIAITVFCILSGFAAGFMHHCTRFARDAKTLHYMLQSFHDPATKELGFAQQQSITIETPTELRSIVKKPIRITYQKVLFSDAKKKNKGISFVVF